MPSLTGNSCITDQQSGRCYLDALGDSLSLLQHSPSASGSGPHLLGVYNLPIQSWGEKWVDLQLGSQTYQWQFLWTAVTFPILGLVFLHCHGFLLDISSAQLVQSILGEELPLCSCPSGPKATIIITPCDGQGFLHPSMTRWCLGGL